MRRAGATVLGTWVVLGALLGVTLWAGTTAPVARATATINPPARAAATPSAIPSATNVTSAHLTVTTPLPGYTFLPGGAYPISFYLVVVNATVNPTNVQLWANVTDAVSRAVCANLSLESLVAASSATNVSYAFTLNSSWLGTESSLAKACPGILADPVALVIVARVDGRSAPSDGTLVYASSATTGTTPVTSLVFASPSEALVFGTAPASSTYNVSAVYSGQYVTRVELTVFSSAVVNGSRSVVFSADLLWNGSSPTVSSWYEPRGGNYPYFLELSTPYESLNTSGVLAITNATLVYFNQTNYDPQGFMGLDPAEWGTVLLAGGLVIGMGSALATGRLVGRGPRSSAAAPADPAAAPTPRGAVSCSICGKPLDSPAELAAHRRDEHGME